MIASVHRNRNCRRSVGIPGRRPGREVVAIETQRESEDASGSAFGWRQPAADRTATRAFGTPATLAGLLTKLGCGPLPWRQQRSASPHPLGEHGSPTREDGSTVKSGAEDGWSALTHERPFMGSLCIHGGGEQHSCCHPPQIPHAFPSSALHGRPRFVLR